MGNDNIIEKACSCGGNMTIHMHTLVYNTKVRISDVPVYTCESCSRYEPLPAVTRELGSFVQRMGREGQPGSSLSFAEHNEWAFVLKEAFTAFVEGDPDELEEDIRSAIQNRIDLLLDVYRLAGNARDQEWLQETGQRLSQLTLPSTSGVQ